MMLIRLFVRNAVWSSISSGGIATPDCGTIDLSGFSTLAAFFSGAGTRSIETKALNLISAG